MAGQYHNRSESAATRVKAGSANELGLSVLRGRYYEYVSTMRAGGGHLLSFNSPCCRTQTQTLAPEDDNVWKTTCTCPWCGRGYAKIVSHDEVKVCMIAAGVVS